MLAMNIMESASPNLTALERALQAEEKVLFAYLFGSAATGKMGKISDVDIAIYPAVPLSTDDRLAVIYRIGKATRLENLDIVFLDRIRNLHLLETIIDEGILLADKNPDFREHFEVKAHHRFLDFQYQRKLYLGE